MRAGEPHVLGIDIGGTKVVIALGDSAGNPCAEKRIAFPASGDPERDLAVIVNAARDVAGAAGLRTAELAAIGVCAPGPLDPATGSACCPPNLPGWERVPLVARLSDAFGMRVALENDANAAALAEARFGAGRGARDVVFLTLSTGVGAGLVLDGKVHRGLAWSAGEIGHAPVEWDGWPCVCGLRGCLEAYVGGAAWTARLRASAPSGSLVVAHAGVRANVTPEHVISAARAGDSFALGELARFVDWLARGLVVLAFTLAPEVIVLGTIPTAAGEALCFEPLRRTLRSRLWPALARDLRVVPSALGSSLPARAAISVALDALTPLAASSPR